MKIEQENQEKPYEVREIPQYLSCADNGNGMDITTGFIRPLKTFGEWLDS